MSHSVALGADGTREMGTARGKNRHIRRMERCPGCEYWNPVKYCLHPHHACMNTISVEEVERFWRRLAWAG